VSVEDGRVVGEHRGLPFYTVGQGAKIRGALERYVCRPRWWHCRVQR